MYIIRPYYGDVLRSSDMKIVSPTSSETDLDYLAYIAWVKEGNEPTVDESFPPEA